MGYGGPISYIYIYIYMECSPNSNYYTSLSFKRLLEDLKDIMIVS